MADFLGTPAIIKRTFDGRPFWDAQDVVEYLRWFADKHDSGDVHMAADALASTLIDSSTDSSSDAE